MSDFGFLLGGLVQWLRAKEHFPEWAAWLVFAAVGIGAYWLTPEAAKESIRSREFWQHAVTYIFAAAGVTQGVSSLANSGVNLPRTNVPK